MKLNQNQRKTLSEILNNILTAIFSISIISQIVFERKFDYYSVTSGLISLFVCTMLALISLNIVK